MLAVLDLDHLARQTFADGDLERDLLDLMDRQCARLLLQIEGEDSPEGRRNAAHALRGAALAIGAFAAAQAAQDIEDDPAGGGASAHGALVDALRSAIDGLRAEIACRLGTKA